MTSHLVDLYEVICGEPLRLSQLLHPETALQKMRDHLTALQKMRDCLPLKLLDWIFALAARCGDHVSAAEFDEWVAVETLRLSDTFEQDALASLDLSGATRRHFSELQAVSLPEPFRPEREQVGIPLSPSGGTLPGRALAPLFDSSCLMSNFLLLVGPGVPGEKRFAAATRLALKMPARLANPAAQEALRKMAEERNCLPKTLLRELLLPTGLFLAAAERHQPQEARAGKKWMVKPDGTKAQVCPAELPPGALARWLVQQAYRAAADELTGPASSEPRRDSLDRDGEPENPYSDQGEDPESDEDGSPHPEKKKTRPDQEGPLVALIAADTIQDLLDILSPQERQVLLQAAGGTPADEAAAAVAPTDGAARTLLSRFRKKSERVLPLRKKARRRLKNPPLPL